MADVELRMSNVGMWRMSWGAEEQGRGGDKERGRKDRKDGRKEDWKDGKNFGYRISECGLGKEDCGYRIAERGKYSIAER